jgi:hypothetical protein
VLQLQQLYIEVMYTIQHRLGANSAQYHHIKEELFTHAQVCASPHNAVTFVLKTIFLLHVQNMHIVLKKNLKMNKTQLLAVGEIRLIKVKCPFAANKN